MEISITFQKGPINAEIKANEEEDYEEVLKVLSDITENYSSENIDSDNNSETATEEKVKDNEETDNDEGVEQEFHEQEALDDFANRVSDLDEIPDQKLYRLIKTGRVDDGEIAELPRIIMNTDQLGDSQGEKLLHASILILSVFDDFHNMDKVKTSDLKQSLKDSDMNTDNFTRDIDGVDKSEIYLNRRGRGPSATTEVRPPGKDKAYRLFENLASEVQA